MKLLVGDIDCSVYTVKDKPPGGFNAAWESRYMLNTTSDGFEVLTRDRVVEGTFAPPHHRLAPLATHRIAARTTTRATTSRACHHHPCHRPYRSFLGVLQPNGPRRVGQVQLLLRGGLQGGTHRHHSGPRHQASGDRRVLQPRRAYHSDLVHGLVRFLINKVYLLIWQ